MPRLRSLILISLACASSAINVTSEVLMFYESGAEGSGPMPCSASLAAHAGATNPPTATISQYLNEPIGVQAFSVSGGADAPVWSYWPESVDMDLTWETAGSAAPIVAGAADTVVLQYSNELFTRENANCTLFGVATSSNASSPGAFSPLWTVRIASCAPSYQPQNDDYGQIRSVAVTADGATVVAVLVIGGAETLLAWSLATGAQRFSAPMRGSSYGVQLTRDSQWILNVVDDGSGGRSAFVYSAATGAQRGAGAGCRMDWNAPPAISDDGGFIAVADQNGMGICAWSAAQNAYGAALNVDIPSRGQVYWFPFDAAFLSPSSGGHFAAFTYAGGDYSEIGRLYAVDADAVVAGSTDYIVLDSLLDSMPASKDVAWALVRSVGDYWAVGTTGGTANATLPTEYLFAPGTVAAPSLDAPLWKFTGGGSVNNIDAALISSTASADVIHILAAGPGNVGPDGNGGQAYWHELTIQK